MNSYSYGRKALVLVGATLPGDDEDVPDAAIEFGGSHEEEH